MTSDRRTRYPGIYRTGDNRFQIRIQAGKNPVTGKRVEKVKHFEGSLTEALDEQANMRRENQRQATTVANGNLAQLCERYLEHAAETLSPSTVRGYRGYYEGKIKGTHFGARSARSITTEEFDAWFQALRRDRGIKGQSVNRHRAFLNSVYRQSLAWRLVPFNPVEATTPLKTTKYRGKAVPIEVIEKVFRAYELSSTPLMGKLLQLSLLNQLRRSEVCGLRVEDFAGGKLAVERVIVELGGGGYVVKEETKNGDDRCITLDALSILILEEVIGERTSGFIFSDNDGVDPWLPMRVTRSQARMRAQVCPDCDYVAPLKRLDEDAPTCDDCGAVLGVYFRCHDLRAHTTTKLIKAGLSKAAQTRGGWKNQSTMLKHYMHLTEEEDDEAVATITQLFGKPA
jgi:integrase